MKTKFNIFRRISILVFALITILGVLFIALTYFATTHYHLASTQLLNKDVAAHIAKFASPYNNSGINKRRADSVFKNAMIISPSVEVYFLDTAGTVLDFYGPKKDIRLWKISLQNIDKYIASKGEKFITAPDPRDPSQNKIFSAAAVENEGKKLGYIYVIIGSNEYRDVSDMLWGSHINSLAIKAFIAIILLSIILSLLYINRIKKSYNKMVRILKNFEDGDFTARFKIKDDELSPVSHAFNKMADMLTYNINQLTSSESERKDFVTNISHDLRTPLSIARGYAETILIKKENISKGELDNYVEMILKKILQVEYMVTGLFEISKMDSVEFKANKEPFVLSEIVQETVNTFQLNAKEKMVNLNCTECQYHVWINGDIRLLERAIQNLVDNAVKDTVKNGEIKVGLSVEKDNLIFKIENEGPPLNDALLQWINNPATEYKALNNKPGKGLGLLITKKILDLHSSMLHAYRNNDTSNIFTFSINIYK